MVACSQSTFHVTGVREGTKTDKTRFFFAKKKDDPITGNQMFINVPNQSTEYIKEGMFNLCVDNKILEFLGDLYCPTCENENCVYISTNKTSGFYDCKKCEASCYLLNIPFKKQKLTLTLFGGDGTCCCAKRTSRDYEKSSPSLKIFLHLSQTTATEPKPKTDKVTPHLV